MNQTNLSCWTEAQEVAGTAGSTDLKGDSSVAANSSVLPASFKCWIRWRANSHVSRTSSAGSESKLFFRRGTLPSEPIAPNASAAYEIITKPIVSIRTRSKSRAAEEENSKTQNKK